MGKLLIMCIPERILMMLNDMFVFKWATTLFTEITKDMRTPFKYGFGIPMTILAISITSMYFVAVAVGFVVFKLCGKPLAKTIGSMRKVIFKNVSSMVSSW